MRQAYDYWQDQPGSYRQQYPIRRSNTIGKRLGSALTPECAQRSHSCLAGKRNPSELLSSLDYNGCPLVFPRSENSSNKINDIIRSQRQKCFKNRTASQVHSMQQKTSTKDSDFLAVLRKATDQASSRNRRAIKLNPPGSCNSIRGTIFAHWRVSIQTQFNARCRVNDEPMKQKLNIKSYDNEPLKFDTTSHQSITFSLDRAKHNTRRDDTKPRAKVLNGSH